MTGRFDQRAMERATVREAALLDEIKLKLDQARDLAVAAAGFGLFYFIEMAILETEEMSKNKKAAGDKALGAASGA
jgi:hypothetical protein